MKYLAPLSQAALAILTLSSLVACGDLEDQRTDASTTQKTAYSSSALIGDEVIKIIVENCYSCHSADNARGGVDLTSMDKLVANKVAVADSIISGSMPQGAPLKPEQVDIIKAWKAAGYPLDKANPTGGSKDGGKDGGKGKPSTPPPPPPGGKPGDKNPGQNDCVGQSKCDPSQNDKPVKK